MTPKAPIAPGFSESAVLTALRERIERGIYAPGTRLPAERMLATEFGVSRSIIRAVYAQLVQQGLIEQPHYRRPHVAFTSALPPAAPSDNTASRAQTTQTIAAILPSHPVFPGGMATVAGIHKLLSDTESPYRLTFLDTFHKDRPEVIRREVKALHTIAEDSISGLIWWHYSPEDDVRQFMREHPEIAIVFIDRYPENIDCDFVGIDDANSSQAAVEYLIDLNHKRIAHLMDPGDYITIQERAQGYRDAHISRGLPFDERLTFQLDWSETRMEDAFRYFYSLPEPPTALFATNDFIAYEFLQVAEAHGVRTPNDLSIVGHGNMERFSLTPAFLTTVDQCFENVGRAAAKLLLKRLSAPNRLDHACQHVILSAPLVVRKSCRRLE